MDPSFISELYSFNRWANHKAMDAVARLSQEMFLREMGNSFASVRDTLVHTLSAEVVWVERFQGRSPDTYLQGSDFPTVDAIRQRWEQLEQAQIKFLKTLTTEKLTEPRPYRNVKGEAYSYPLWQEMVHLVNHSSYHRGQITTLLRQLGAEPVSTDLLLYYDEQAQELSATQTSG